MKTIPYRYKNCPIPGGGYVTGFLFGTDDAKAVYIRTDIGGAYRYEADTDSFKSLSDYVSMDDLAPTYVAAIALDEDVPGSLYVACGLNDGKRTGELLISKDYGKTFTKKELPALAHGNLNGRGTGKRLVKRNGILYFASYEDGLLVSNDEGSTWKKKNINGENHLSFVFAKPDSSALVVATAGVDTKVSESMRGHSLYISYDNGETFEEMSEPETGMIEGSKLSGLVGHRYAYDGKFLYITANHTGETAYIVDPGYSCDCGKVMGGVVLRYSFDGSGKVSEPEVISPDKNFRTLKYGYGGISFSAKTPGLMVLSTITKADGDVVYRSKDFGETWEAVLWGLKIGDIGFNTPYMRPECNGNDSLIHWLSDIEINPHNDSEVWFNTGTGVFRTKNFLDAVPHFEDASDGIEETVHLNVYAPIKGPVKVIDILGDLGGFAFTDIDKPCDNSFADADGNRYITCINADFSDSDERNVIVTPRGNWTGKTKGGLIVSDDYCKSFKRLSLPYGMSKELDEHFRQIECPNVNSGWVAMSADANTYVWSVADMIELPMELCIVTNDRGASWKKVSFEKRGAEDRLIKIFSDRMDSTLFYGFTENGNIYESTDSGNSFTRVEGLSLEGVNFGKIDCADKTEIRGESGKKGCFYIACGEKGLWKLEDGKLKRLSKEGDTVYRVGLGIGPESDDYLSGEKALYMCGIFDGVYGFYRSVDDCKSVCRINNDTQMFGDINSIDGDKRVFGRFFLATGSRGIVYGEEAADD